MKKILLLIVMLVSFCNVFAELVVLSSENENYVIDKNSIVSIEPISQNGYFFSKKQNKIIFIASHHGWAIKEGLENGNLIPVKNQTKIKFKSEPNTQVAVAGAAVISGGDAKNNYEGNFIVVNIPIESVIEQLKIKK